jgi:cob(I)alamin adenosyltransferase
VVKIYTKRGDKGKTELYDGDRVSKTFSLIHALGDLDELNSFVGMARAKLEADEEGRVEEGLLKILGKVQKDLYRICADLAGLSSKEGHVSDEDVKFLEENIDDLPLDIGKFVPPGDKGELSARLHVCRSVCRRAERSVIAAFDEIGGVDGEKLDEESAPLVLQYLNRLSDLFFAMAEC